jgi:uncharacterized membrane protein
MNKTSSKKRPVATPDNEAKMPLGKQNYILLIVGFVLIVLGFVLMSGGGSDNPDEFNYAMFNFRRITLAPILSLGGFVLVAYAIMKKNKKR